MPYVNLPTIGVVGEWSATDAERDLAGRLAAVLPEAPSRDADAMTRWEVVALTLATIKRFVRDHASALIPPGGHVAKPDRFDLVTMAVAIGQFDYTVETRYKFATATDGVEGGNALLDELTAELEPQLATLRRALAELAGD